MTEDTAAPEELAIHIPGLRLAALAWGPRDGPLLLALHGWLDNAASFSALAPSLHAHRVVAPDFPGHGHSQHRPEGVRYHFIDYVADTLAVMDALGWERCTLLGHSLGGAVASVLAGAMPERVSRVVLIEALGPLPARDGEAPSQFAQSWRRMAELAGKRAPVYDSVAAAVDARVRATGMSPGAARPIVARGLAESAQGLAWRTDPRLTLPSLQRLAESQIREYLSAIRAPVLLVTARSAHEAMEAETLRQRARRIERLELCTLGGSHHLHLDDAAAVARVIEPFLARKAAEPPTC